MHSTAFPAFANHFYGITSLACMFCKREDSSRYILHHILGEEVLTLQAKLVLHILLHFTAWQKGIINISNTFEERFCRENSLLFICCSLTFKLASKGGLPKKYIPKCKSFLSLILEMMSSSRKPDVISDSQ